MATTCSQCNAPVQPTASRCLTCGRSLLSDTKRIAAKTPPAAGGTPTGGGAAETALSDPGTGLGLGGKFMVHALVGAGYGVIGFLIGIVFLRRAAVRSDHPERVWMLIFVVGFCLPAVIGFFRSIAKDKAERDMRRKLQL